MKQDYLVYVEDIITAMNNAQMFVRGLTFKQFEDDIRNQYAAIRALEIVGEATKRLPMTFRDQHPHIPWKDMAGMRDRIIHGYDNVDLEIVWLTLTEIIPQVKPDLQLLIDNES